MIDILMLTHNKLENTITAVNHLYENTPEFRLVVIDDSTDGTMAYFSQLRNEGKNIEYVRPNIELKSGNQAINYAMEGYIKTDPFVFMCNSTFVLPGWLKYALRMMADNPKCGMVGFKLLFWPHGTIIEAGALVTEGGGRINIGMHEPGYLYSDIYRVNAVGWAVVLIRKSAMFKLDENRYIGWRGSDDVDNCLEFGKRGWQIWYDGFGAAFHILSSCMGGGTPEGMAESAENNRRFIEKWAGKVPAV